MTGPVVFLGAVLAIILGIFVIRKASLEGKLVFVFSLLALAAYFRLHFYLLLLTALSLFAFILIALIWANYAISRITITRKVKDEAMAGENVPVEFTVKSRSRIPLFHTRIWDRINRDRSDNETEEVKFEDPGYVGFLRISRRETSEGSLHVIPPVRGILRFGPIAVQGGDPFGIFNLTKWYTVPDKCLVLPGWVRLTRLPTIPGRLGMREQNRLVQKEGHSHEFIGTRPYSEGDSLRGVHWPLTAKHDELIVRQYQKEVEEELLVVLDADRIGDVGEGAENSLEYLVTISLSLVHAASEHSRPWSLILAGEDIEVISHRTKDSLLHAQYVLARLKPRVGRPIEHVLDEMLRDYPMASCILLTPRIDSGPTDALYRRDATMGGISSTVVRANPDTFASTIQDGARVLGRRMGRAGETASRPMGPARVPVTVVRRGDRIEDTFLGQSMAGL